MEQSPDWVRVLLVEDDEDDFVITRGFLREIEGTWFDVDWVDDPDKALARLASGSAYDICLLDYRLGRCNGLDLLQVILDAGYPLPIIVLTGQEDQDVDREAVRLGASDYLIKGRIDAVLLERSIRYALRQKRTEEALRRQSEFVSAVLDTASALVVVLDDQGCIRQFNRACEEVTGFTFAEVAGRPLWESLLPTEEREAIRDFFATLDPTVFPNRYENAWVTRCGGRRQIAWSNAAILGHSGKVEYVVSVGTDVTEQRLAEAALAEAREREISVGASIQKTLLVRRPRAQVAVLDIGWKNLAAQRVGGDYLDFIVYNDSCLDLLVGDVMGKGVAAALLAAAAKSHFQRAIRRLGLDLARFDRLPEPEEIVTAVRAILTPELFELNSFVTLAYARFDTAQRQLTFVDCGHLPPLHLPAGKDTCRRICGENMPLGMKEDENYRQSTVDITPGDLFVFYSDGITEACSPEDELFGEERLIRLIQEHRHRPPQEIADRVCAAVASLRIGSAYEEDDLTCVVIRVQTELPHRPLRRAEIEVPSHASELERIRMFVERFCADARHGILKEQEADQLTLALNEAAANVIRHAYRGRQGGRLWIAAEEFDDQLRFVLCDNGVTFENFGKTPPPAFDGSRDSGFGLFLMRLCLDEIEYARDEFGRNTLTLVKRLTGAPGNHRTGARDLDDPNNDECR